MSLRDRISRLLIPREPPVPDAVLGRAADRFGALLPGATVCVKVSAARSMPYPFTTSAQFVARVISEIQAVNPSLRILLTEGGLGDTSIETVAAANGLTSIANAQFVNAESDDEVWVDNGAPGSGSGDGFWLPRHWVEADARVILTTCKLRSHHFRRWYSGGIRNLIGLLPRSRYRLSDRKRNMRSSIHQSGMDQTVADLYSTTGSNVLTVLDARLLAREDEHLPLRFVRRVSEVIVRNDPRSADTAMVKALGLPFVPPYLALLSDADRQRSGDGASGSA